MTEFDLQDKDNEDRRDKIHEMMSWYQSKHFKFPKLLNKLQESVIRNIDNFIDPSGNERDFTQVMEEFVEWVVKH